MVQPREANGGNNPEQQKQMGQLDSGSSTRPISPGHALDVPGRPLTKRSSPASIFRLRVATVGRRYSPLLSKPPIQSQLKSMLSVTAARTKGFGKEEVWRTSGIDRARACCSQPRPSSNRD